MKGLFCLQKTCKTRNNFHHTNECMSHLFQGFNASSLPRGSVCIARWEVAWRGRSFSCSVQSFGLTTGRRISTCTHFRDQIVSWDLSLNDARAEFKANPVQRKSDLIFTQSSLNVIMPKSSWLAPHPLRCSRRRAFGSLKTLFNPSRRISHHLSCGSLPLASPGSRRQILFKMWVSFSLHSSLPHSLIWELTVLGQLLWSTARCFKRY